MFRRSIRRACVMTPDYVPINEAYGIFGYKMGDHIDQKEVKKRFNKLALHHHPDRGGDSHKFMKLLKAHKVMQTHAHDKKKKKAPVTFEKEKKSNVRNSVTHENFEEVLTADRTDGFLFLLFFPAVYLAYNWYAWDTATRLSDSRSRMTEDELDDIPQEKLKKNTHEWHPWRANADLRDQAAEIEGERLDRVMKQREGSSPWGTPAAAA